MKKKNVLVAIATLGIFAITACGTPKTEEAEEVTTEEVVEEAVIEEAVVETPNIVDVAAANENFSTLVLAVNAAGLVETLSGDGPFTVFAPTNDAFAALPEGTVENLLKPENLATLSGILTYHVVSGKFEAAAVVFELYKGNIDDPVFLKGHNQDIVKDIRKCIKAHIVDQSTIIPFILFKPLEIVEKHKGRVTVGAENEIRLKPGKDVVIILMDLMSSFTEFISYLITVSNRQIQNKHYLIMNFPGQPYTVYDPKSETTTLSMAKLVDLLIGRCVERGLINLMEDN